MVDVRAVKDALARLAGRDDGVVDRAERAVGDVEMAARFRATGGLARLRATVAAAEGDRAERGRAVLAAFDAFAAAASGDRPASQHFRRGDGTALRSDDKGLPYDAGDPHR